MVVTTGLNLAAVLVVYALLRDLVWRFEKRIPSDGAVTTRRAS